MNIIKIDKENIYCYVNETFIIFKRNKLITGTDIVGWAWAAGKPVHPKLPLDAIPMAVKIHTCFHNMIISELLKRAETEQNAPEN